MDKSFVKNCPKCKTEADFKHIHNCAHGIRETHMAGSERYECSQCGYTIYKSEGEGLGFIFVLD